ncbi:hypothetical protein [Corynebacterium pseudotuberculosis]|uniref:hypothetical protein n=1 Tax=Corynebacterium pseudotuberculosis TaxID=1719 RepID=UPI0012DB21CB|nr:hypothetical protein [Corynebacterium pseudotuberculosis]
MAEHANGVTQKISNHTGGLGSFPSNVFFSTNGGNAFKITSKLQNNKAFITVEIPYSQHKYTKMPDGAPSAERQATLS